MPLTQHDLALIAQYLQATGLVRPSKPNGGGFFTGIREGCFPFPVEICVDGQGRVTKIVPGTPPQADIEVQDEGATIDLTQILNFVGAGVTAVADAPNDRVNIIIPGGAAGGSSPMCFGNNSVAATTTTRYLEPWYEDNLAETNGVENARIIAWRAGTIRNLRVIHGNPNGNNNPIVYTARINGVATAISASLGSNTRGPATDLIDAAAVVAGDEIDIRVTKALAIGSSPNNIFLSMEFA